MIIDLAHESPASRIVDGDICIAGAGPAGITLAMELARMRPAWRIILLEAGGPDVETMRERDIYKATQGGQTYGVLDVSRRRTLGGSTAHWGGWCKPLDPTDFQDNPAWDLPAWPFAGETLTPYINRALPWVDIDNDDFTMAALRQRYGGSFLPLPGQSPITESLFRFSPPTRFGDRYIDTLRDQENLDCYLHANLFRTDHANGRVSAVHVTPLDGEPLEIRATTFVMAMGGMETTRMLLNMRGDAKADGPGLYSPHLGKYFADHFGLTPGLVLAPDDQKYDRFFDDDEYVMPVLRFNDREIGGGEHNSCIMLRASSSDTSLLNGYGGARAAGFHDGDYWHYALIMVLEPRPNPASTLTLTGERCELGLRRLQLDWHLMPEDFHSGFRLFETLGQELKTSGLGRMRRVKEFSAEVMAAANGSCHHLGTTRMAADPRDGVVDANLKVFDMDNLYLASSSVFPRYGYSNPTLTIIALSLRLAEHLGATAGGNRP